FIEREGILTRQAHGSAGGTIERADDVKERAFPRPAGADNDSALSGGQFKSAAAQHDQWLAARGKLSRDVLNDQVGHGGEIAWPLWPNGTEGGGGFVEGAAGVLLAALALRAARELFQDPIRNGDRSWRSLRVEPAADGR